MTIDTTRMRSSFVRGDRDVFPPYLYEAYRSIAPARAQPAAGRGPAHALRADRAGPGDQRHHRRGRRPDPQRRDRRRGDRPAHHRDRAGARRARRPVPRTLVEVWQANAAGRYLPPQRPVARAARPQLPRHRPLPDRRPGRLPLPDHPTGRLPLEEPSQRLAARAHPFLAVRPVAGSPGWSRRCTSRTTRSSRSTRSSRPSRPTAARPRLVATYDHDVTEPEWALGWRWDIVLRGPRRHAVRGAAGAAP